jgi:hypothetical protein
VQSLASSIFKREEEDGVKKKEDERRGEKKSALLVQKTLQNWAVYKGVRCTEAGAPPKGAGDS